MLTLYKDTQEKVCSIFLSLVWYATNKIKKKKKVTPNSKKIMLSALPGIRTQNTTTVMDPVSKTVYGIIQIGLVNNIYNKLIKDEDTNTTIYKIPWLLVTTTSGNYADDNTKVQNQKEDITRNRHQCRMCQQRNIKSNRKLSFVNVPVGTADIKLIHDMHSPLLSGDKFVKKDVN